MNAYLKSTIDNAVGHEALYSPINESILLKLRWGCLSLLFRVEMAQIDDVNFVREGLVPNAS